MEEFNYQKMLEISGTFSTPTDEDLNDLAWLMTATKNFYPQNTILGSVGDFINVGEIFNFIERTTGLDILNVIAPSFYDGNTIDSKIPAGYTYLGQFIDHDISQDSKTDREKTDHHPFNPIKTDDIRNLNNPVFDLETIYGKIDEGEFPESKYLEGDNTSLKLGEAHKKSTDNRVYKNDFYRDENGNAIIPDMRNDGFLVLAQMQIAFMKFHNAVVKELVEKELSANPATVIDYANIFKCARKKVIRHYQYIILNDYLPQIIQKDILETVKAGNYQNKLFKPDSKKLYLPLEFTVGAFRFGHSTIRSRYNLNNKVLKNKAEITLLLKFIKNFEVSFFEENLPPKSKLRNSWIVNWKLFFDIEGSQENEEHFNFAKKVDTKYESLLGQLKPFVEGQPRANSLSAIDLYRGVRWNLPTGQLIAEKISTETGAKILSSEKIRETFTDDLTEEQKETFSKETPLLYFILAEAEKQEKPLGDEDKLGEVGSWILAEVFIKLLYESPYSILIDKLEDDETFLGKQFNNKFGMAEMLLYAQKTLKTDFDEVIDPFGQSSSN